MHLRTLTNAELLRIAYAEYSELTSTSLELELLRRLEEAIGANDDVANTVEKLAEHEFGDLEAAEILERAAEHEFDADGLNKLGEALIFNASNSALLLSAIGEAGFDSPAEVKREFELAQRFRALANDAGDMFARLSTLTETATA